MDMVFATARNTFSGISMLLGCLFTVVLRPDSESWTPLMRLHDQTRWTHHSLGLLWLSDQPNTETST